MPDQDEMKILIEELTNIVPSKIGFNLSSFSRDQNVKC